jgi:hypothetical protein
MWWGRDDGVGEELKHFNLKLLRTKPEINSHEYLVDYRNEMLTSS